MYIRILITNYLWLIHCLRSVPVTPEDIYFGWLLFVPSDMLVCPCCPHPLCLEESLHHKRIGRVCAPLSPSLRKPKSTFTHSMHITSHILSQDRESRPLFSCCYLLESPDHNRFPRPINCSVCIG